MKMFISESDRLCLDFDIEGSGPPFSAHSFEVPDELFFRYKAAREARADLEAELEALAEAQGWKAGAA